MSPGGWQSPVSAQPALPLMFICCSGALRPWKRPLNSHCFPPLIWRTWAPTNVASSSQVLMCVASLLAPRALPGPRDHLETAA